VRFDLFQIVVEIAFANVLLEMQDFTSAAATELVAAQKAAPLECEP
jgi:hypothetical protein